MRFLSLGTALMVAIAAPYCAMAEAEFVVPNVTVGRNLQANATVRLKQGAPAEGAEITITSDDPSRLLLSDTWNKTGVASISLKITAKHLETPEFWLQAKAGSGTVTYTVSAGPLGTAKGTATLAPSAIAIAGPHRAPKFPSTPRGVPAKLTVAAVFLDASGAIAGEQLPAGGSLEVSLSSSNPKVGTVVNPKVILTDGSTSAVTYFQPSGEGETVLSAIPPAGFSVPANMANVTATVAAPGLALVDDIVLGKNCQTDASMTLGEVAPQGGLKVTLTSSDPSKLLLSKKADEVGSASIVVDIPAGQFTATYFLQGLSDTGEVTYKGEAPGYRARQAKITMASSGVIVAYEGYGPPDEANVKRKVGPHPTREFSVSVAEGQARKIYMVVWMAYIDRETGRCADFTVQALRAGMEVSVPLTSSDPSVATVASPVIITGGRNRTISQFVPLKKGNTIISVGTPKGFGTPENATSVPATVRE